VPFFQVFGLLRVCLHGFLVFAYYFSAAETLFKHTIGGKLSAANYSTVRTAHLVKHSVSYHDGSEGHWDVVWLEKRSMDVPVQEQSWHVPSMHWVSGIARPSGLGGHTYRWVSAARLGEDQKGHNFPSRRCQFVARISCFEIILCLSLIYYSNIEWVLLFFKVGWAHVHPGPPLAKPLDCIKLILKPLTLLLKKSAMI